MTFVPAPEHTHIHTSSISVHTNTDASSPPHSRWPLRQHGALQLKYINTCTTTVSFLHCLRWGVVKCFPDTVFCIIISLSLRLMCWSSITLHWRGEGTSESLTLWPTPVSGCYNFLNFKLFPWDFLLVGENFIPSDRWPERCGRLLNKEMAELWKLRSRITA